MIFWRQGRSLPYGDGITFWALAEIVKAHAGILATDPPRRSRRSSGCGRRGRRRRRRRGALDRGAPRRRSPASRRPGAARRPSHGGVRRLAAVPRGDRRRRPLVLVFEDLHWADDALLDFISDHLGTVSGAPLLVSATCRPELFERRPGWGRAKRDRRSSSWSRSPTTRRLGLWRLAGRAGPPAELGRRCSPAPAGTRCTRRSTSGCCSTAGCCGRSAASWSC